MNITQNAKILAYLRDHGNTSVHELFIDCGVNSPRKRLSELAAAGANIGWYWDESTDEYDDKRRYKRYFLEET